MGGGGGVWGHDPPGNFRLSEIESGAFSGTTLTDEMYCGMGVLEALVAIQIRPCDIVTWPKLGLTQFCTVLNNMLHAVNNAT